MNYPSTAKRQAAEEAFEANPTKRNLKAVAKASEAEMSEVLAAFDARNGFDHEHSEFNCETCADRFTYANTTI